MRFRAPREAIFSANNESEIQRILERALAGVAPDEIDVLPAEARRALAQTKTDLTSAAVTLLQQDLLHRGDAGGELLRQLAELTAAASVRLMQLRVNGHSRPSH